MKYFNKAMILEEVKAAYRAAAMTLHSDKSGSNEAMQQLNKEFVSKPVIYSDVYMSF